jgi:hypothetical protein
VESLFDDALLVEVRELPDDLAWLDALLSDLSLFGPIGAAWVRRAGSGAGRRSRWPVLCA